MACPRATGEKVQAKAVPSVGRTEPVAHFGLTQRGHSHHQETWHSISVANGCTHLGFADPLSSSRAMAGCPAAPAVLPCHATAESHKQCVHWEPSSSFLGVLLFTDNAEITSAIVANISDCTALQKQTHKVSD